MMPLITHWHGHCLVPQKGRGWLIKYWLKRDDLFKAFCKDILQNMDGLEWQGHLYLTVSISAFLVFFHAFSYTGVYFLYNIQHFYPLIFSLITSYLFRDHPLFSFHILCSCQSHSCFLVKTSPSVFYSIFGIFS